MRRTGKALPGVLLLTLLVQGAAPPASTRALTTWETFLVNQLQSRLDRHATAGEFEQAVQVAEQIAAFRAERQGARHWEAIDARLEIEQWRSLKGVPASDRANVVQARNRNAEAVSLLNQGRPFEAEKLLRQGLALREKILGKDHPHTAQSYNNVAVCLEAQGRSAEALLLHRQILARRDKALGNQHPDTATSCNNVAHCLEAQGKYPEAYPLLLQALAIHEKVLGKEHPNTATSYNNLAHCLKVMGKPGEALPLLYQAVAIREKVLGKEHPETATVYSGVASCLLAQGKLAEALPLFRKALDINEKILGKEHPRTATSYNNVADCLLDLGKSAEALPMYFQGLAIREKVLGKEHPSTAASYNGIASCLQEQGKLAEALHLFRKALDIQEKVLGKEHPDTATMISNLASCLQDQGQSAEAMQLYRLALNTFEKVLGKKHPSTALGYNNVAACLLAQGKATEALPLYRQALAIHEEVLGKEHPSTATSYNNVAGCLQEQGKLAEALTLFRQALAISERVLGKEHFHTAQTCAGLACCLHDLHKPVEASRCWEQALLGYEFGRLSASNSGFDRSQFLVKMLSPRTALATIQVELSQPVRAWEMAESDLGRGLLDDLSRPDQLTKEDQAKLVKVQGLQKHLLPLLTLEKPSVVQQKQIVELGEQRNQLQRELAEQAVRRARERVLSLAEVQKQIPEDTALVFWLDIDRLKQHLGCVLRHRGEPHWVRLPGSGKDDTWQQEDSTLVARTLAGLSDPQVPTSKVHGLVQAMRRQRLAPLEKHLAGAGQLLVVPAWDMASFPVEVLSDRYTISYVSSASVHARAAARSRPVAKRPLLVLADPVFDRARIQPPKAPGHGLLVTSVLPGSLASRIGLGPGDVLLEYDGKKLNKPDDLKEPDGDERVRVALWREGMALQGRVPPGKLGVTVDRRPVAEALADWRRQEDKRLALVRGGQEWERLPGTRLEALALAALRSDSTLLLGSDASEQRLTQLAGTDRLRGYGMLHLATHGEANPLHPELTALILAQDKLPDAVAEARAGRTPTEGKLTVGAVLRQWKLDADLVTLSACQTGLGQQAGGEGMLGFAQALLNKGARSVLLSRWKVDDAATGLLMTRFYQNVLGQRAGLKAPLARAEALREAKAWLRSLTAAQAQEQLGLLLDSVPRGQRGTLTMQSLSKIRAKRDSERIFDHPYYWAAFILVGDPK